MTEAQPALRRMLLLGGSGLLGSALQQACGRAGIAVEAPASAELDLRDLDQLRRRLRESAPDLLLNCAAQSSVDRAERDPDGAFQVNALGAHNCALAAAEANLPLLHVSTDYVFDGERRTPYREHHPTGSPRNVYGRSKLQGEQLVRDSWRRHFIVRVAALFGAPGRPDFIDWVLQQASPSAPLTIVADRFVTPSWTVDLAQQLLALAATPLYGTYHATGQGVTSWFELARTALQLAGKQTEGVLPVPDAELAGSVQRPFYTALDNHLLRLRGLDKMRPWREALRLHLRG